MNYLLTGATGFIGRRLVQALLSEGHSVSYLARKRSPSLDSRASFFCWNPEDRPPLECITRIETVVHLAGEPVAQRWTADVKRRIYDSRVQGTGNLVSAIANLKHKPSALVSASAIGYYGDRGDEILAEDAPPASDFLADLCLNWEREAVRAREFGTRVVPIRIGVVLGQDGGALQRMMAPFRLGLGGKLGSGRQWMSWIHIDDIVRLILFASTNTELSRAVTGCSPQPVTNAEFTRQLAGALRRRAPFTVPKFALKLAMGEVADALFGSVRAIPKTAEQARFTFLYPNLCDALTAICHQPKTFERVLS